jgi:hypothetical protein
VAGDHRNALLEVAERLAFELGYGAGDNLPGAELGLSGENGAMARVLNPDDERLVERLRSGLTKVAVALGGIDSSRQTKEALDGIETVMRGELVSGNAARLPALMPDFVFLVALSVVSQDKALLLSIRARELVEGALG